jgi:hypothetical protein
MSDHKDPHTEYASLASVLMLLRSLYLLKIINYYNYNTIKSDLWHSTEVS